ncbi:MULTISPECIES: LuxR C-terminal-related transcriptional regulator [unclassified Sphingomonas]|uniref:LuxR C-terminal-related transcriptional regulator n=1 Tax=unclassified Sphingomonas TaxID=196159 RepID=UPI00226A3D61|nr:MULTISPECIES: LuxR C-terminal-related transcriptional regulator [unclassified Sphingomonas]
MTQAGPRTGGVARASSPGAASALPDDRAVVSAPPGDSARFDRLSRRHRECLRAVRQLKGSKEIAEQLGIEKSTVDSYITEAVKLLGARNRREAALWFAEHEAAGLPAVAADCAVFPDFPAAEDPDKIGGDSARLAAPAISLPPSTSPDEPFVGQPGGTGDAPSRPRSPGIRLPFRRKGQAGNELSIGSRLIWIQAITLGIAIGFGMLMIGLQILTGMIESVTRHLS